ncbi:MAG: hypothetical protein U0R50_05295 [Gaiellales bacterium]
MRRIVVTVICLLAAASSASAAGDGTGVDAFVVRLQPNGIVCIKAPCWLPLSGISVTFVRDGQVVARGRSGRDGHLRIRLAPGSYVVRAPEIAPLESRKPRVVRVVSGRMTRVLVPLLGDAEIPPPRK